jgi:hypothetical protein
MPVRALAMVLVLTLGACSISGFLPDWSSPDVAGPEPAYRFIIANSIGGIVGSAAPAGTFEISALRRVDSLKGPSWLVCIRTQNFPQLPHHYAVFLQNERVVNSRLSVLIDQCEMQTYLPFDWVAEANAPPAR